MDLFLRWLRESEQPLKIFKFHKYIDKTMKGFLVLVIASVVMGAIFAFNLFNDKSISFNLVLGLAVISDTVVLGWSVLNILKYWDGEQEQV